MLVGLDSGSYGGLVDAAGARGTLLEQHMDAGLNRKSLMFGVPGIILQIAGRLALPDVDANNPNAADLPMVLGCTGAILVGTVLLIIGLSLYARAKGHSGWWGLMGLLSIIGLIVLACLPDRLKGR